jgi:hypothetical protein
MGTRGKTFACQMNAFSETEREEEGKKASEVDETKKKKGKNRSEC